VYSRIAVPLGQQFGVPGQCQQSNLEGRTDYAKFDNPGRSTKFPFRVAEKAQLASIQELDLIRSGQTLYERAKRRCPPATTGAIDQENLFYFVGSRAWSSISSP
jgi:hypothetical protein